MAQRPRIGGVFSPRDIAQMSSAYEAALVSVSDERHAVSVVPSRELRHRLAGLILSAARSGPIEADVLARTALGGLQCLTEAAPLTAMLGHR